MKRYIKSADDFTGSTITVDLNTNVLPVISIDLYSRSDMIYDYDVDDDFSFSELDSVIMQIATPYIQDTIEQILPSVRITPTSVSHPSYYNFACDELNFTLSVSASEYNDLKQRTLANDSFASYLKQNYKSYDGFVSYMASDIQKFNEQEPWKQLCQIIMFYVPDTVYYENNRNFDYDLMDYLSDTYYRDYEDDNI